jgi:hypothetical protein
MLARTATRARDAFTKPRSRRFGLAASAALCAMVLVTAARSGEPVQSRDVSPPPNPQIKAAPQTPIAIEKVELDGSNPWDPAWDIMIEKELPHELLSRDRAGAVRELCPRFGTMTLANRRAFWAYFFQALAAAEAGLKPTADVRHNDPEVAVMDTVSHRIVRQQGLLQLTYMDSARYRCAFDWSRDKNLKEGDPAKTILEPRNNLRCGIRILDNQLVTQRKPLLTESSYWETLRPGHAGFLVFLKQMVNVPAACSANIERMKAETRATLKAAEDQASREIQQPAAEVTDEGSSAADANAGQSFSSEP